MKFRWLILVLIIILSSNMEAQRQIRIGYIDMDYILENLPDYNQANQELDQKIQEWKKEIDFTRQKIQELKDKLDNERALLTQNLIDEQQDEIDYQQQQLIAYQQKRFGPEGDMNKQRQQILKPIQDQVFNATYEIGERREYDFIFDSSEDALMLFAANRHDLSDQVLAIIDHTSSQAARVDQRAKNRDRSIDDESDEFVYKSVSQAREDKETREEREGIRQQEKDERNQRLEKRQAVRDSVRTEQLERSGRTKPETDQEDNLKALESKKDTGILKKEQEKDSIRTAEKTESNKKRQDEIENRQNTMQQRKDSIEQARQVKLEERQRRRDSIRELRQKNIKRNDNSG